jgi:hypothetical protein
MGEGGRWYRGVGWIRDRQPAAPNVKPDANDERSVCFGEKERAEAKRVRELLQELVEAARAVADAPSKSYWACSKEYRKIISAERVYRQFEETLRRVEKEWSGN